MAKLTTKGTTILARWRKDWDTPDDDIASARTREFAVRSNGVLLQRDAVRFCSDTGHHDYGWKVYGRAAGNKPDLDAYLQHVGAQLEAKGFESV